MNSDFARCRHTKAGSTLEMSTKNTKLLSTVNDKYCWKSPSGSEIPSSMKGDILLGRSDHAAVYLSRPAGYSGGLRFDVIAVGRANVIGEMISDETPQLTVEVDKRQCANNERCKESSTTILRRICVENNVGVYPFWRSEWYLSRLPDHDDLTLTCAWSALGLSETRVTISGDAVREAASRAHNAWGLVPHHRDKCKLRLSLNETASDVSESEHSKKRLVQIARRWWRPPIDQEIPASIGVDLQLGLSEQAALYLSRPAVYTEGLRFDVVSIQRKGLAKFVTHEQIRGTTEHGSPVPSEERLRLRVEFEDGQCEDNIAVYGGVANRRQMDRMALYRVGFWGGSDDDYYYYIDELYLWTIPGAGDVAFVCQWPALGLSETHTKLNGDVVRQAVGDVRPLWE